MDEIKQIYLDECDRQREWGSSIRYFDEFLKDSVKKKTITEKEYQQYFDEDGHFSPPENEFEEFDGYWYI